MTGPPGETSAARSESDQEAASRSWLSQSLLVVVVVLLGSTVLIPLAGADPILVGGILALLVGVAIGVLWWRADDRSAEASETEDASVWNAIPSWQYSGRHVESGGLARGEQEEALADVQQQAEEIDAEQR